jgi:cobalt-zinc-cadmium efflux system outer membrane protein
MPFCIRACAASVRVSVVIAVALQGVALASPLTLEEAWRAAEEANPALRAARAESYAAEGRLAESRPPLFNNPELSIEASRTRVPQAAAPDNRFNAWRTGISQPFEIAGQQGRRREAARADVAAFESAIAEARAGLRAEVEQRFVQVLAAQLRGDLQRAALALVEQAAQAMEKRRAAGEVNRLDANLALVEAERTRNQLVQLGEQLTLARAELAALLQLAPGELPEVQGELRQDAPYSLEDLLQAAARRPLLRSLALREDAARSRLALERAGRYPDVTLGAFGGRDGPPDLRENILGLSVSLPLPIFRRNEAGIGRALTELTQTQVERQAAQRNALAGVRAEWIRVQQLEARATRLRDAVLRTLEENQRLSQRALKEGEIGVAELLLVNRQVADVRRDLLDAQTELRLGRVALERAAGWPPSDGKEMK